MVRPIIGLNWESIEVMDSFIKGLQKFDENKTPLYSQTNDEKIVFNFDKTHLLSFFLPVYNSLRQVDFKLSLLASTDGGN